MFTSANRPLSPPVGPPPHTATATSEPFTPTASGTYRWIASYSGDVNNDPANTQCNDPNETSLVGQVTIETQARTPVTLANLSTTGPSSRLPRHRPAPTGVVTFTLFGPDDPTCAGPPMLGLLMVAAARRFHGASLALAGVGAGRGMTLPGRRLSQFPVSGPMAFRGDQPGGNPPGGSGGPPGSAAPPAPMMGFDHRGIWGPVQTVPTPPSPNQVASGLGLATGGQSPVTRGTATSPAARAAQNLLGMGRNRQR